MQGMQHIHRQSISSAGMLQSAVNQTVIRKSDRGRVCSNSHRGFETMAVKDIRCLVAEHKYVMAYGVAGQLLLNDSLQSLEHEFPGVFVRIHRNALVGRNHLLSMRRSSEGLWRAVLAGTAMRPLISRRLVSRLKRTLLVG